jgi:hypothetical protein
MLPDFGIKGDSRAGGNEAFHFTRRIQEPG